MGPTGSLIIGHTTESSARIWLRGGEGHRSARVRVRAEDGGEATLHEARADLDPVRDFTAVVRIDGLGPDRNHTVLADFAASETELARGRGILSAQGSFRTFPPPGSPNAFSFLHGSCNLSIVSLTDLGSLLLGALGSATASRSLERPSRSWWRGLLRVGDALVSLIRFLSGFAAAARQPSSAPPAPASGMPQAAGVSFLRGVFALVFQVSRYKQPKPVLPSPFCELCKALGPHTAPEERPAFMIHAGDQIYFDFPLPRREPTLDAYRLAYREAFFEDPAQRDFLASCPQYMTLDDHELVDEFALDHVAASAGGRPAGAYYGPGLSAYREYVHARHPAPFDGPLWYEFQYGASHFMVLDTRSERCWECHRMLDDQQLAHLEGWLEERKDELKFVVSSVPFLAELRSDRSQDGRDEREDKWVGRHFRRQRDDLLELIHGRRIGRLVFLVGDMHCAYHAITRIGAPERRTTLHELAGGPIHQLEFAKREAFHDDYRGATQGEKIAFRTRMRQFHGAAAGVLQVTVRPGETPAVLWKVVRTSRSAGGVGEPRPLCGRIDL